MAGEACEVVVIGAGPAGMAAAGTLTNYGLRVTVIDEQEAPGGQIWRAVERRTDDPQGRAAVARFRACGAAFLGRTRMWHLERTGDQATRWRVFLADGTRTFWLECRAVLLATGAQERPVPIPGWTLPGVMTIGAGQILLKTAEQMPQAPLWIAGAGPLPLLYMVQLLRKGGQIAGFLETSPPGGMRRALPRLAGALRADWRGMARGLGWQMRLRLARVPVWRSVTAIAAHPAEDGSRLGAISFSDARGRHHRVPASVLLHHRGLLPIAEATRAAGCDHEWLPAQGCFAPRLSDAGMTSLDGLFLAGDGAGIAGMDAAQLRGQLAALGICQWLRPGDAALGREWNRHRDALHRDLKILTGRQKFIDALYPPSLPGEVGDDVLVCRCEEVRAGTLRAAIAEFPDGGPDQIKIKTRCGMGACQGRQCGDALLHIFGTARGRMAHELELFRARPPLRPLSFAELADLGAFDDEAHAARMPAP